MLGGTWCRASPRQSAFRDAGYRGVESDGVGLRRSTDWVGSEIRRNTGFMASLRPTESASFASGLATSPVIVKRYRSLPYIEQ
jgi:hypothetical protein